VKRAVAWVPLPFAAVYAAVLAATFGSLVGSLYSSADVAAAPYIGQLWTAAPSGAHVVLGHIAWYEALWGEWLTRGWPLHRQLWEVGPWLVSLAGIALVAWATAKAAGRFAAMLVAVSLVCAGAGLISYQFPAAIHALTWVHVCLLGCFLVFVADRGRAHPLLWTALVLVTAGGVASDRLLVLAGVAPFVLAAAVLGRRSFVSAAVLAVVSIAGAQAIVAEMQAAHVRADRFTVRFGGWHRLGPNVRILGHALLYLFNGDVGRPRVEARWLLGLACALVLAAAALLAISSVFRYRNADRVRAVHLTFWWLAGSLLATVFVLTNVPVDRFSARYIVGLGYAIVVVAAVAAARKGLLARSVAALCVCVLVTGSIVTLLAHDLQESSSTYPSTALAGKLLRFAQASGIRYGYAGYWDAAPLTWETKAHVQIYPVGPCPTAAGICGFPFNRISSWYVPRPATRTFLVVDPARPAGLAGFLSGLGRPERSARVGRLSVFVYDYDIAARFGRAQN
jgi:hypothetical protein